ncbi:hypothetical protein 162322426 [Organic Lake phycodnavirus 1]|jgi:hypothetical protein|nr:hypothetical protein 162322426 [Organic Lake phycodnavirus 1]
MEQTKTIFVSMIVILLATLGAVAYILKNSKKTYVYPPHINDCPDFYQKNNSGYCYDKYEIGPYSSEEICKRVLFKAEKTNCDKKKWATDCKVSWDGITNNDGLCI